MKKGIIFTLIAIISFASTLFGQNDTVSYFKKKYTLANAITFDGGSQENENNYIIITHVSDNELEINKIIARMIDKNTGEEKDMKLLYSSVLPLASYYDKLFIKNNNDYLLCYRKTNYYDDFNHFENIHLTKYNSVMEVLWEKEYGEDGDIAELPNQLSKTLEGGYIIGGRKFTYGEGTNPYLIKLDSIGNIEWERVYPTEIIGAALYVYPTYDGGYIFSGYRGKGNSFAPYYNPYVTRVDSAGNVLWDKVYYTELNNISSVGVVVPYPNSQNYLFFSYIDDINTTPYIMVSKMDDTGELLWEKSYKFIPPTAGFHTPPQFTSDEGFVIGGHQYNENSKTVVKLFRFTAEGDTLWTKDYDIEASERQYIRGLLSTSDGGYLLTGLSYEGPYAWEIKIDSLGNTCWQTGCDSTYVEIVGLEEPSGLAEVSAVLVSPNPAQDEVRISLSSEILAYWELYDLQGKLLNRYHTNKTSTTHLAEGIYLVKAYDQTAREYVSKLVIMH
ncbi:MAG: T9SS type A sorting domain-containing protein [Chitinophagales bacterium]|nr:T9SS type A sorting domain-containing protein [Chitinophagales bacterium]